jgi:branched-chain amino acid aminotransferase
MLPYTNRSFLYGDGLFETLRIQAGNVFNATAHCRRLKLGFQTLQFSSDTSFITPAWLEQIITSSLCSQQEHQRVRITFFRAEGGLYTPSQQAFGYTVNTQKLQGYFSWQTEGLMIGISKRVKLHYDQLSSLKTCSALPYVLAGIEKKERNLDAILLENTKNQIAEGQASNLFAFFGKTLVTPPLSSGCVQGTMRSFLLEEAPKVGFKSLQKELNQSDLEKADEIFLSNAIQGIRWVSKLNPYNKRYKSEQSYQLFKKIFGKVL